jgi:protocatechuate 3,4-dioxygenase beta subunit
MILVCFWDMEQRPSRYCIRELAKKAEELKEKGVTIVGVHASKVDGDKLSEWVKKYNIMFPVGMVEGDEEKTRFAWGVKSLPWLVLTDKKHIVRAEGFGIQGLDEKMQVLVSKEQPNIQNKGQLRTIHFPTDASLGQLKIRKRGSQRWQDWEDWGPAKGDVFVPEVKELRLSIYEAFESLPCLSSLGPDDLQELYINSRDMADDDLVHIRDLAGLKSLHLSGTCEGPCPFTGEGLLNLQGMTKLRSLMLDFTSITDDSLVYLKSLKSLKKLSFWRNRNLTGEGLVHLKDLPLRELAFYIMPIEDDAMLYIKQLKSLEILSLQSTNVTDAGLAHLECLPRLKKLVLPKQIGDAGLNYLKGLTSLEELVIYSKSITDAGLAHLKNLPSLKSLKLFSPLVTSTGVKQLTKHQPELDISIIVRAEGFGLADLDEKIVALATDDWPSDSSSTKIPRPSQQSLREADTERQPDSEESQTVTGVVKDHMGNTIAGAQVGALPMSSRSVTTDRNGRFEISWKRQWEPGPGHLYLMARSEVLNQAALIQINRQTKTIEIKLEPAITLTGTVTDSDNKLISGAEIDLSWALYHAGTFIEPTITDDKGQYKFNSLPQQQEWAISVMAEGFEGQELATGVINMKKEREEIGPIVLNRD